MIKTIDTLVEDIYNLIKNGTEDNETFREAKNQWLQEMDKLITRRLVSEKSLDRAPALRVSVLGACDRKIYYDIHQENFPEPEKLEPHTLIKFLYGDLIEELILLFARLTGHKVEREQEEVDINGVKGHIDAIIDDVLVDVKSASAYSFRKFEDHSLEQNDPFGYMSQLSGYNFALKDDVVGAGFLAVNKELGKIALMQVPTSVLESYDVPARVEYLREVIAKDSPPDRCYEDEDMGKSGNRKLGVNCSYCKWKTTCWSDANNGKGLRTFIYSTGPVFLTKVSKIPNVIEVT